MSSKCFLALVLAYFLAGAPQQSLQLFEFVEPHMGTLVQIKVYAPSGRRAEAATRKAFDRIAALDDMLSDYKPDSELNRVCRLASKHPTHVSADLLGVLAASQKLATETGGAFDITVGPLTHLWREARKAHHLPDQQAIREALAHCGYGKLSLDFSSQTVKLAEPGMQLDLGAIGKGYAADEAIRVLREQNIQSALVSVSGDLAFSDAPPGERGWRIGLNAMTEAGAPREIVLFLKDGAASTSGDSEQHLDADGKRYSHILNPQTGMPLTQPMTATVIAQKGINADPQATALCVLGPEQGIRFVERSTNSAAAIVVKTSIGVVMKESSQFKLLAHRARPVS